MKKAECPLPQIEVAETTGQEVERRRNSRISVRRAVAPLICLARGESGVKKREDVYRNRVDEAQRLRGIGNTVEGDRRWDKEQDHGPDATRSFSAVQVPDTGQ
jgi:hypothetical protein